jgi:hypothetical protein
MRFQRLNGLILNGKEQVSILLSIILHKNFKFLRVLILPMLLWVAVTIAMLSLP